MSHKPPDPGQLRHQLIIEQPIPPDGTFDVSTDAAWSPMGTRWGSLDPLSGQKLQLAMQTVAEVTHECWLRYDPSLLISPACRISFRGRAFNIVYVLNLSEQGVWLYLLLKENVTT